MRIIGGENRKLKLAAPRGREVRPILDRVRESLFGILRNDVPGAAVADLFAGTGVIGLEALSRGAASCVFVDRDPRCVGTIRENVRRAGRRDQVRVVRADALRSARPGGPLEIDAPFDLIFVDPPYRLMRSPRNRGRVTRLVEQLGAPDRLSEGGVLVLRYPRDAAVPARIGPLAKVDRRRYGGMKIALFARTGQKNG
ncbi:MAG: 16S rRNA (guanine(966)-N(2))-methyltransferase RsmD [Planctomycetota bacterium]